MNFNIKEAIKDYYLIRIGKNYSKLNKFILAELFYLKSIVW